MIGNEKNTGKIIIGIVIVTIIIVFIVTLIKNNSNNYTRPNYDYAATIYHSEMLGIDAGTEYTYYIYKSDKNNNEYFYIKSEANITLAGAGEQKDVGSGSIKNKNDLKKIMKDIKKDSKYDSQTYISYIYGDSGPLENIDELESILFN